MAKKVSKSKSKISSKVSTTQKEGLKILSSKKRTIIPIERKIQTKAEINKEAVNIWLKENCVDCPPTIIHDYCISGHKNKITESKIAAILNGLFSDDLHTKYKVGKTCQAESRVKNKDYKGTYSKMYILYKSTKPQYVSAFESHFINQYFDKLDNVSRVSNGRNCSIANYYYVYVVVH